ncbi:DUF4097 domain-containing protein [Bacillus sp. B15-48]|uniref:DUF4097 family beta strand repeat-containing protein n=1 Tax=Bacillus sp. B15-48 TaxID=1548601 RepID=UPI00193ECC6E|nr:DUF4097 domain-containing protein [Bacillus sp. B15-48]MBM4760834.1 DUF4097 family beta strand repeat protein [Bacillus sp. B15-48]
MKEERKKILKLVEDGKLAVDEALFLIEELEKKHDSMEEKKANLITELSTTVKSEQRYSGANEEEARRDESTSQKIHSAVDKFVDFVDTAFKKIKDFDLDFNFGQSIDITHIFQQGGAYLKDIDIDIANGSIDVIPWDQDDVRIECATKVYRVESQEEARRKLLEEAIFAIEAQKLRFSSQQKWMKMDVIVYLPRTDYEKARIRLFNGSITARNLVVDNFKVKTANGKVSFENLDCNKLETETANGHIELMNSRVDDLEAETLNGAINAEGTFRRVDLQSFSGSIHCTVSDQACENIEAKTATGGIHLVIPQDASPQGELRSNLGQFKLEIDGLEVVEEKSEMVQKFLRFAAKDESRSPLRIYADSKTGAISLKKIQ